MSLTLTTYAWVPPFAQGWVRDIRVRWACEEAGLPYALETVSARPKSPEHLARQPFGQVPILRDGDLDLFESGAIVLHLAEGQPTLMPEGSRPQVQQWAFAALSSVEPYTAGWTLAREFDKDEAAAARAETRMQARLAGLEPVLAGRDWLVGGQFTAADILMADVLRNVVNDGALDPHPALKAYVARATARPAFQKAHADQMALYTAA